MFPRNNPRSGFKRDKYRSLIVDSRRDKVKELLVKGYSQAEISEALKISQPTISRDLQYIDDKVRKKLDENDVIDLIHKYYLEFLGVDQMTRALWEIVDNPKSKFNEKLKAIILLKECSLEKLLMINNIANNGILPYIEKQMEELNKRELEVALLERNLEIYIKKHNLNMEDIKLNVQSDKPDDDSSFIW